MALVAFVALWGVGAAEGRKKKPKTPPRPPADLPGHVSFLAWQLRGVHIEDADPLVSQIQKLVGDHLNTWIQDRVPTSVDVRRELEQVFDKLRYPTSALPACFAQAWKGSVLIGAGYTLGWPHYNRVNQVLLYESRDGKTRPVACTSFVPWTDLRFEFLPAHESGDFRFFIYGFRPGKSQPRLSATLYAFDGRNLESLWETHEVFDGKMEVTAERVTVRYLKEDEYIREVTHDRKPPRHQKIYKITPQGLELESDREIPF